MKPRAKTPGQLSEPHKKLVKILAQIAVDAYLSEQAEAAMMKVTEVPSTRARQVTMRE